VNPRGEIRREGEGRTVKATNLGTLALADGSASSRKWTSETRTYPAPRTFYPWGRNEDADPITLDAGTYRLVEHYGTLMLVVRLSADGLPDGAMYETTDDPRGCAVIWERAGGSMSDRCGLSRIRSGAHLAACRAEMVR